MGFKPQFCYQIRPFSGLQEFHIECPYNLFIDEEIQYGVEILFHQSVCLSQLVMTTAAPAQPVFFIQHPSGVRYLIRAITSSTQEVVFNHLGYEVGTPVDPRPFLYWAKLPAGSRLQITSDGETEAATFSLVLEALSS